MTVSARRIVVVGLGSMGRKHARLLAARGDLHVEWCETSRESLDVALQELGRPSRLHASFEAMLSTQPAMIVIATPHAAHAPQAIAALHAGIDVLCEKPLSDTLEGAQAIAHAAKNARSILTVGFILHFHPGMQRVKALIRSGELGSIHHLHALVGTYPTLVNSKSRYQANLLGALFMDYAHQPDVFHFMTGETPSGVFASGGQGGALPLQSNPNFAALVCDYAKPMMTTIHLIYLQLPERHEYEIIGDRGWVTMDMAKQELRIGRHADNSVRTETFSAERDTLLRNEHQAFLDAVDRKRPPESPADDALVSARVIDAALKSFQTRNRIALSP